MDTERTGLVRPGQNPRPPDPARLERVLLACGAIGPLVFVLAFLVEGATRAGGYDPLAHPVSSLAIGEYGWTQRVTFLVTGALVLASALGLRSALRRRGAGIWAPLLIGICGIGMIGAGVFIADPHNGYPLGTPLVVSPPTTNGALHDAFSSLFFLGLPAACLVAAYRFAVLGRRGWAAYSAGTAVAFLGFFVLTGMGFAQHPALSPIAGLLQRLTIVIGWAWLVALALDLRRRAPGEPLTG
jgi:hypothetical membrane protein